jgi:ABC-2 type transport system ATP-binding protein
MTPPQPPAAASDLAIEARGLVKVFGETRAVDGIDLDVLPGTVYGFLGPNGAVRLGKYLL